MSAEKNNAGKMVWLNIWMAEKKDCREELLERGRSERWLKELMKRRKRIEEKWNILKIRTDEKNSWRGKLPKKVLIEE